MTEKTKFGFTDDELLDLPQVFNPDLFKGKVVLVSGAGSGIGKAIAFLYAKLGANIVICGRKREKLEESARRMEELGATVLVEQCDIREPDQVHSLMDATWEKFGKLDVLINNAGGQFPQMAIDYSYKGWRAVINTNLNGTWYMMQSAAQHWRDHEQPGHVVNIVAAISRGMPGVAHTCSARAGVVYLAKTVAVEWAPLNIQVNCVAPGAIESSGMVVYSPEEQKKFYRSNPMKVMGDVHDIAQACAYLTAPSGKFITGEVINVDGGTGMWGDVWPAGKPDYFKLEGEK